MEGEGEGNKLHCQHQKSKVIAMCHFINSFAINKCNSSCFILQGNSTNPWLQQHWEKVFNCSFDNKTCSAISKQDFASYFNKSFPFVDRVADAVLMMANASSRLLNSTKCSGQKSRDCLTGPNLLRELKATRQMGYAGWLELDANGDRPSPFTIYQLKPPSSQGGALTRAVVAKYDMLTGIVTYVNNISWHRNLFGEGRDQPESRCSDACKPREKREQEKVDCCWTCVACAVNEYVTDNGTQCIRCRNFFWPDPNLTSSSCSPIPPYTPWTLSTSARATQITLALLCLVAAVSVFVFFLRHGQHTVIRASSRQLSFLMLLAIVHGYTTVIMLLAPPNDVTCRITFLLFCLSFTLLYGSLLVRTVRIFRIFRANLKSTMYPSMTDGITQVFLSLGLLLVQVSLPSSVGGNVSGNSCASTVKSKLILQSAACIRSHFPEDRKESIRYHLNRFSS